MQKFRKRNYNKTLVSNQVSSWHCTVLNGVQDKYKTIDDCVMGIKCLWFQSAEVEFAYKWNSGTNPIKILLSQLSTRNTWIFPRISWGTILQIIIHHLHGTFPGFPGELYFKLLYSTYMELFRDFLGNYTLNYYTPPTWNFSRISWGTIL